MNTNDFEDEPTTLGFDPAWDDYNEPTFRCEHGTYVGSWAGPDYICGWCEEGVSVEEMRVIQREQEVARAQRVAEEHERLMSIVGKLPWSSALATVIYEWGTTNHQYVQAAEVLDRLDAWPN